MSEHDKAARGLRSVLPEVRTATADFEVRSAGENRTQIVGYASTVNQPYTMHDFLGEYQEQVRGGAFSKTLSEGADVAFLLNHSGTSMARTQANTLVLREDSTGLLADATLDTNRTDVRDMLLGIEDGNLTEMSFGFRIVRQEWDADYLNRELVELNLDRGDVSVVNYGANPNTSIGLARAAQIVGPGKLARFEEQLRSGGEVTDEMREDMARLIHMAVLDLRGLPAEEESDERELEHDAPVDVSYLQLLRDRIICE